MSKKIFKYDVPAKQTFSILMPVNAEILSVHVQNDTPRMWVIVNDERGQTFRHFLLMATGKEFPEGVEVKRFIGTFLMESSFLVFHLFEL